MNTPARNGLDMLLAQYPSLELVAAVRHDDWLFVTLGRFANDVEVTHYPFAIRKSTGAVYEVDADSVADEPLFVP